MNFECWGVGTWEAGSWVVGSWCPGPEPDTGGGLGLGHGYVRRWPALEDMDDDALAILLMTEILLNE